VPVRGPYRGSGLYNALGRAASQPTYLSQRGLYFAPGPMPQGFSYVQISGLGVYKRKHNTGRAITTPPVVLVLSGRGYAGKCYREVSCPNVHPIA
jgi:hypothetical protein